MTHRGRFLEYFRVVFVADDVAEGPAMEAVPGELLVRVDQLARTGDTMFLRELMNAGLGWYSRTAEGGEWLNEMLWENLAANPSATLAALGRLSVAMREQLMEVHYTRPVHDGFDFAAVVAGLEAGPVPAGLEADVERILVIARGLQP